MNKLFVVTLCLFAAALQVAHAQYQQQQQQYTTPVPILKQIDRQNDDGSYTYGYEAADQSFKIETKYPNGEVYGKYGYVDDQGKVREIEYGASKRGFEPAGSDINVPPPTLTNSNPYPLGPNERDDGQYREDPAVYYKDEKFNRPVAASKFSLNNNNNYQQPKYQQPQYQQPQYQQPQYQQPQYQQPQYQQPRPQPAYKPPTQQFYNPPAPKPQQSWKLQSQPQFQPQQPIYQQPSYQQPQYQQPSYQQPQYQQPQYNNNNNYNNNYNSIPNHHHPALKNLDISSGSYSIDYTGRK